MVIRELYIRHFGKFRDARFVLSDGIQVFYGENEYGKSTIYAFIRAMLFGMERGRGRAANHDMFSRYEPWENPGDYAGSMRFSCGERTFLLERRFSRYEKRVSLVCEDDGEQLSVEDGDLEMLLGGMTASSFDNIAAIGQMTARPGQSLAAELKNYAANSYETGGGCVDYEGAVNTLRESHRQAERDLKAWREAQERKEEQLQTRMECVEAEVKKLEQELQETEEQLRNTQKERNYTTKGAARRAEKTAGIAGIVLGIAGCILAGGLHAPMWGFIPAAGVAVLGAVFLLASVLAGRKGAEISDRMEETGRPENVEEEERGGTDEAARLDWTRTRIIEELQEKRIQIQNIREQIEETGQPDDIYRQYQMRIRAAEIALERLQAAAAEQTRESGERLNREIAAILSAVTDGKYNRVLLEDDGGLFLYSEGRRIPAERLSHGTVEQVYFALRMAALELLYTEEEFPVIFDDAFACYDENRLKSTLRWLDAQSRQVILFSCQKREKEMVEQLRK